MKKDNRRILLYSTYDSFINTGLNLCLENFNKHPEHIYIHRKQFNQVSKRQTKNKPYEFINIRKFFFSREIENFDIIILSFGIKEHVHFNHQLTLYGQSLAIPLLISCMPGTGFNRPENYLCRLYTDVLLLNCRQDYDEFIEDSKKYHFNSSSGFLYGLPQVKTDYLGRYTQQKPPLSIVFFDQLTVPNNVDEKREIVNSLIQYAIRFPDRKVYIKSRMTQSERTFHKHNLNILYILDKYYPHDKPSNLLLTDVDIPDLVEFTDICVTVSSTVAIEYLAYGKQAVLISDFGIKKELLNNFFSGSEIFASFKQLSHDKIPTVNKSWFEGYVSFPSQRVSQLNTVINSKLKTLKSRSISTVSYKSNLKLLKYSFISKLLDLILFKVRF